MVLKKGYRPYNEYAGMEDVFDEMSETNQMFLETDESLETEKSAEKDQI